MWSVGILGIVALGLWWMICPTEDPYGVNESSGPTVVSDGPDWPGFMGRGRDGRGRDIGLMRRWPPGEPREVWRVRVGGGYSGLAVSRGRLITMVARGKAEMVIALDAASGRQIWATRSADVFHNNYGDGPRATPQIDDERVYTFGASGQALCLSVSDGRVIWSIDTVAKLGGRIPPYGFSASPLVDDELVVLHPGGTEGSVVALDKHTGQTRWVALDDQAGYASPLGITDLDNRQVVALTARRLVGLSVTDGRLLWQVAYSNNFATNVPTPVWWEAERLILVSSGYDAPARVMRLTGPSQRPDVEEVWSSTLFKNHPATSVLVDGRLYGFHGSTTGVLKCLDMRSGRELWANRSLGKGTVISADGLLIVYGENGSLALAAADPAGYAEAGRVTVFSAQGCRTPPSLADGRLFVRGGDQVVCLALKP